MKIRKAHILDRPAIATIYKKVAQQVEGIVRRPEEITETYVFSLLNKPDSQMIFLVAEDEDQKIIGFGHAEKGGLKAYNHILSNFTIGVNPENQDAGVGKAIFKGFLDYLSQNRPDIKRLEMDVQYEPSRITSFEATGFKTEAIIKGRVLGLDDKFHDQALMAWENPNFKP